MVAAGGDSPVCLGLDRTARDCRSAGRQISFRGNRGIGFLNLGGNTCTSSS
jgi:hypothetical protein